MNHFIALEQNGPPQAFCPYVLREKGPRRGQMPWLSTAQKIGSAVLLPFLVVVLTGCSDRTDDADHRTSPDHLGLSQPGEQLFTCSDSSAVVVEVLPGGLELDLRRTPGAASERLTAAAEGLPFVGQTVSIAHSHDTIAVMRRDQPAMVCRRTPPGGISRKSQSTEHPETYAPEGRKPK